MTAFYVTPVIIHVESRSKYCKRVLIIYAFCVHLFRVNHQSVEAGLAASGPIELIKVDATCMDRGI